MPTTRTNLVPLTSDTGTFPYLGALVAARVNPIRFQRGGSPEFDATIEKMIAAARRFDAAKVRADQLAAAAGASAD